MTSSKEISLQYDLFTRELVDNRTSSQRRADQGREQPQQTEMFSQRDLAQFGVRARPQMSLSPHTKLVLIAEDPRTPEEVERDRQRAAEALTYQMFTGPAAGGVGEVVPESADAEVETQNSIPDSLTVIGFRVRARRARATLRTRKTA
jgi:hypothetical protein